VHPLGFRAAAARSHPRLPVDAVLFGNWEGGEAAVNPNPRL